MWAPLDFAAEGTLPSDFEVREVLNADLPMACGSEDDVGDLVIMARKGIGGSLPVKAAEHLLYKWNATPRSAALEGTLKGFGWTRMLLVADPYVEPVVVKSKGYVLDGVTIRGVRAILDRVVQEKPAGDLDEVLEILRLCAVHEFMVSVTEPRAKKPAKKKPAAKMKKSTAKKKPAKRKAR